MGGGEEEEWEEKEKTGENEGS